MRACPFVRGGLRLHSATVHEISIEFFFRPQRRHSTFPSSFVFLQPCVHLSSSLSLFLSRLYPQLPVHPSAGMDFSPSPTGEPSPCNEHVVAFHIKESYLLMSRNYPPFTMTDTPVEGSRRTKTQADKGREIRTGWNAVTETARRFLNDHHHRRRLVLAFQANYADELESAGIVTGRGNESSRRRGLERNASLPRKVKTVFFSTLAAGCLQRVAFKPSN